MEFSAPFVITVLLALLLSSSPCIDISNNETITFVIAILVVIAFASGFFAGQRYGCGGKKKVLKSSKALEKVGGASTDVLLQNVPQESEEPHPDIWRIHPEGCLDGSSNIPGGRPQIYPRHVKEPRLDPNLQHNVADSGEFQTDIPSSQDDLEYEFPPVHYRPSPQDSPSENLSQCDTEILLPDVSKTQTVPSEPLTKADSEHETMPCKKTAVEKSKAVNLKEEDGASTADLQNAPQQSSQPHPDVFQFHSERYLTDNIPFERPYISPINVKEPRLERNLQHDVAGSGEYPPYMPFSQHDPEDLWTPFHLFNYPNLQRPRPHTP